MPSSSLYHIRENCRMCQGHHLEQVLSLGVSPPANAFLTQGQLTQDEPSFPLNVALCRDCGLVQLVNVVSPEYLFRNYVYVSSTSPSFVAHFDHFAETVLSRLPLHPTSLIIDIGSNDGILLRPYKSRGFRVLGIDPAKEIARQATSSGIETLPDFFTETLALKIVATHGHADLIAATNVFAHIDDLDEVARGIKALLSPEGVFVFENAALIDLLKQNLFDTIYHEHLCYYSLEPIIRFFKRFDLEVFVVEHVPTHGGSLRIFVARTGTRVIEPSVTAQMEEERRAGLADPNTYHLFQKAMEDNKQSLRALVDNVLATGGTIAGYGAPAKATTLLHYVDIGNDIIRYIVDDSPSKQGRYLPGKHIPIVSSERLLQEPPTHLMILAWNYAPQIMAKLEDYQAKGGRFIIPVPTPHII